MADRTPPDEENTAGPSVDYSDKKLVDIQEYGSGIEVGHHAAPQVSGLMLTLEEPDGMIVSSEEVGAIEAQEEADRRDYDDAMKEVVTVSPVNSAVADLDRATNKFD